MHVMTQISIRAKICAVVRGPGSRGTGVLSLIVRFASDVFCGLNEMRHTITTPVTGSLFSIVRRVRLPPGLVRSAPTGPAPVHPRSAGASRRVERRENTGDTGGGRLNVLPDG